MSFCYVYRLRSVIFFAAVLFFAFEGFAVAGNMVIKPKITPGWRYDSNYYKSATNERAVSTYSIKPGITVGYNTPKSKLSLDAALDVQRYNDEDDVPAGAANADEDDYTGQLFIFNGESQMFDRLSIGLDENYIKTRDPASSDDYSNATERKQYILNRVTPKLLYKFGEKFKLLSAYTNKYMDYDKSDSEDSTENRGRFDLFYNLNKTSSFDLDYQVWSRDYDMATYDYTSNQIMLNMTRQYKYFSFTGGVGYHDRSFDNDAMDDIDAFAWKLTLDGQSAGEMDSNEPPRSRMNLSLSQNLNDLGSGNQYYTATRLDAKFSRLFMEKIDVSLKGYFQNSDYEESDRDDDTWNMAAALQYMMKDWITLGCESGYEKRDSNYDEKDYDGAYVLVNAEFIYDLGSR